MAQQQLQGSVEEQAAQLYEMAMEAMGSGRYSAAVRYLKEIERALPGFRDVPDQLGKASSAKREQRLLLYSSLSGAILLIVLARLLGVTSEWAFLLSAVLGLIAGFVVGLLLSRRLVG